MREPAMVERPMATSAAADGAAPARGEGLRGRVLLTGATGFVGQAVLERLLADHPDTAVTVLLRPSGDRAAAERLAELLSRPVFALWRARVGDDAVAATVRDRVEVLDGGLGDLPRRVSGLAPYDIVLHCAGDVAFRGALDESLATNVSGVAALYGALNAVGGRPHVVHVSTAYVWTDRVGLGAERRVPHSLDWREECDRARELRERLAEQIRSGAITDGQGHRAGRRHARRTEAGRRVHPDRALAEAMAQAGYEQARRHGWTDVYTYSKALGERAAEELWAKGPLTILRPTIIESALERPFPGWLDGFKVADPVFAAYAKGRLPGFPGQPDSVIDIVPVDIVVNAVLAAARRPPAGQDPRYVHVGTGVTNPLRLDELRTQVQDYFAAHPWVSPAGRPVRPPRWRFADPDDVVRRLDRSAAAVARASRALSALPLSVTRRWRTRLALAGRQLQTTRQFVRLYGPYSCSLTRYDDLVLRALDAGRDPAERRAEPLDTTSWDWSHYWSQIHLPALHDLLLAQAGRPPLDRRPHPHPRPNLDARSVAAQALDDGALPVPAVRPR